MLIGIVIAVPSGVGVALSALSNNTASLVGVAISAALLPPAVNVGYQSLTTPHTQSQKYMTNAYTMLYEQALLVLRLLHSYES